MPRPKRNYRPIFALSIGLYALMAAAGVLFSVRAYGHLPEVTLEYAQSYIKERIARGDEAGAIAQLRLAADIEFINKGTAVALADVARSAGDLDSEIYARRKIHKSDPRDVDAHNALSDALLRRDPIRPEDAREVIQHGEIVLRLDPRSAEAHRLMARSYEALGQSDAGAEHRREARRLDPDFGEGEVDLSAEERLLR